VATGKGTAICGVDTDLIRNAAPPYASEKPFMCFHSRGMTEHMQGPTGLRKPGLNRPLLSQQDHRTISALTVLFGNLALGLR